MLPFRVGCIFQKKAFQNSTISFFKQHRHFSSEKKVLRLILLGAPGSGKGTTTNYIIKDFGLINITTGDMLREAAKENTPRGREIKDVMNKGGLVSDEILYQVLFDAFLSEQPLRKGWVLDGFPRNLNQAKHLDQLLLKKQQPLTHVFYLNVDEKEVADRIRGRLVHPASGRLYHHTYNPPKVPGKDDVTGEPLVQRSDDDPEKVINRIVTYKAATLPLIEHYQKSGLLQTITAQTSAEGYVFIKKNLTDYQTNK